MSISRRDFMKVFGVSVAALILARCKRGIIPGPTDTPSLVCYTATSPPPTPLFTPLPTSLPARERLRLLWLRFGLLAQVTAAGLNENNALGNQLIADHHAALDELSAASDFSRPVGDLIQEAYDAAIDHVWLLNIPVTCYTPVIVNYAPASAETLVQQAAILGQVSGLGGVDADTLAKAQAALEHDMAFYALSSEDISELYTRLIQEAQENGTPIPSFEDIELELTPEARAAAQFIIDLLTGK